MKTIIEAHKKLFDTYVTLLREEYLANPLQRTDILHGLEMLLKNREEELLFLSEQEAKFFDRREARKVRENLHHTHRSLGRKLGISHTSVCRYENGNFGLRRGVHKEYFLWLKEQGYDPFHIK